MNRKLLISFFFLIIVSLLIVILYSVNQLPHNPNVSWPTKIWDEGTTSIVDSEELDKMIDYTFSQNSSGKLGITNALLITQGGQIVLEKYNDGINQNTKLVSWSMAKSFTGAIAGIMIDKGYISSIDEKNLFPHWTDSRSEITIDHLLNMKSGLEFTEEYNTSGKSDTLEMLYGKGMLDQASFAASFPTHKAPGSIFSYSTGTTNILSKVIKSKLEERNLDYYDFLQENLLKKIGLNNTTLEFDKSGNFIGGSSVYASARDYAKFGYLYLRNGLWEDEQVISKEWIDATRTPSSNTWGIYSNKFWIIDPQFRDGYGLPEDTYYCAGFGGQYILIIPSKDIVLVRLGETYRDTNSENEVLKYLGEIVKLFPDVNMN